MMFLTRQFIVSSRARVWSTFSCQLAGNERERSAEHPTRRGAPFKNKIPPVHCADGILFFMTSFVYFAYFVWLGCLMCAAPKTEPATAVIIPAKTKYPPTLVYPKIGVTGLV